MPHFLPLKNMSWCDIASGKVKLDNKKIKYENENSFFKIKPEFFHIKEKFLYTPCKCKRAIVLETWNIWDNLNYCSDLSEAMVIVPNK